jgi:hypothetical protein
MPDTHPAAPYGSQPGNAENGWLLQCHNAPPPEKKDAHLTVLHLFSATDWLRGP